MYNGKKVYLEHRLKKIKSCYPIFRIEWDNEVDAYSLYAMRKDGSYFDTHNNNLNKALDEAIIDYEVKNKEEPKNNNKKGAKDA